MAANHHKELAFAKDLARQAGEIMRRYFRAEDIGIEMKEDDTPVTQADLQINQRVIERVKATFPDHGVIGEEDSYKTDAALVWVVDPVDGTMPFSVGIPVSSFSLALVDSATGTSLVGVVYDPVLDHLYSAALGRGAFLNDKPLRITGGTPLSSSYISVIGTSSGKSFSGLASARIRETGAVYIHLMSQAYSAAKIATGELHGSVFDYGAPWDCAAASLIVEEAGGVVTDMKGEPRCHHEWGDGCVLSADKDLHAQLLEIIQSVRTNS